MPRPKTRPSRSPEPTRMKRSLIPALLGLSLALGSTISSQGVLYYPSGQSPSEALPMALPGPAPAPLPMTWANPYAMGVFFRLANPAQAVPDRLEFVLGWPQAGVGIWTVNSPAVFSRTTVYVSVQYDPTNDLGLTDWGWLNVSFVPPALSFRLFPQDWVYDPFFGWRAIMWVGPLAPVLPGWQATALVVHEGSAGPLFGWLTATVGIQ